MQRLKILFISGNYFRILNWLNRNDISLDVRRAFTAFQLMTIREENHYSFQVVEHDPLLYEDAAEMVEHLAQALKQTSRGPPSCSARQRWTPPTEADQAGRLGVLHLQRAGSGQRQES
jgi:hypothetical protein